VADPVCKLDGALDKLCGRCGSDDGLGGALGKTPGGSAMLGRVPGWHRVCPCSVPGAPFPVGRCMLHGVTSFPWSGVLARTSSWLCPLWASGRGPGPPAQAQSGTRQVTGTLPSPGRLKKPVSVMFGKFAARLSACGHGVPARVSAQGTRFMG
jgi:hypothetical protein